jgi:hypothetical protein
LDNPGDHDHFKFQGKKGQRVHCVAKTLELGSPCDLFMSLHKADGSQIATARQDNQTVLNAEIPEDGDYILCVEDLLLTPLPVTVRDRETGYEPASNHVYRINVIDTYAGFTLHTEQPQYTAPQGGTVAVKVLAQRRGYDGPIELAVEGLGEGVSLVGDKLEGGETQLKITVPKTVPQGEVRLAKILGKAKIGEQTVTVPANEREPLKAIFPSVVALPTELEEFVAIGIGPAFPPFFELSLASETVYFPRLVGTSSFDININRMNESFKDPIAFVVDGLPNGVAAEITPVDDGVKAFRVSLKGPADLIEQEVSIRISGTGKFQEQTRTVVLEDIKLCITKPLVVSVTLPAPIVAGGQQQAAIHLQRFGNEPQTVHVEVTSAPESLLAPISVTVPSDANDIKIPLAAAAAAAPGKFENLIVTASTTVQGQVVTVQSEPAMVEIQAAANSSPAPSASPGVENEKGVP